MNSLNDLKKKRKQKKAFSEIDRFIGDFVRIYLRSMALIDAATANKELSARTYVEGFIVEVGDDFILLGQEEGLYDTLVHKAEVGVLELGDPAIESLMNMEVTGDVQ